MFYRYGVAAIACAAAAVAWLLFGTQLEPSPFPLFFAAVAVSSFWGMGPAAFAGLAGGALATALFILSPQTPGIPRSDIMSLTVFVGAFLITAWATIRGRRAEVSREIEANTAAMLRGIVDASPLAVQTLDLEGRCTSINPAGELLFGWTKEEFALNSHPYICPGSDATFAAMLRRAGAGETVQYQVPGRRKDGTPIQVEISSGPIRDPGGRVTGVLAVLADVTERHRAETELRQSEERFRLQYQSAPTPIYVWRCVGDDWILVDFNPAGEALTEGAIRGRIGISAREMYRDVPEVIEGFEQCAAEHTIVRRDLKYPLVTTGQVRSLIVHFAFLPPDYIMLHDQDVTQLQEALDAKAESEERYRSLVELSPDPIAVYIDRRIVYANVAAARLLGADSPDDIMGLDVTSIIHPDSLELASERMSRALRTGEPQKPQEEKFIRLTGEVLDVEATTMVTTYGGKTALQTVVRDITERKRADGELRASEQRYRDLFENANDIIFTIDLQGNFTSINRMAECISGYSREEALGMNMADILAPEYVDMVRSMIEEKLAGVAATTYDVEIRARDGSRVPLELSTRLVEVEGRPVGVQGIGRDVSERRAVEEALRESEERYRTITETATDAIITMNEENRIISANAAAERIFGYSAHDLVGQDVAILIPRKRRVEYRRAFARYLASRRRRVHAPTPAVELPGLHRSGAEIPLELTFTEFAQGGHRFFTAFLRDITERKRARDALLFQAMHDTLTGLPNRSLLADRLQQALLTARRDGDSVALLLLDLDRFKDINDTYGHHYGDILLERAAQRLTEILRESDTVARLGGDEFAIILPCSGTDGAIEVAERIVEVLSRRFDLEDQVGYIGASVGVTVYPEHGEDYNTLMQHADVAMYVAKRAGSGIAVYTPDQDENSPLRLSLATELREAIDNENLVLCYQPQIEIATGRIVGVEALVRWQHDRNGLVSPDAFISVAEDTGLIIPLSRWVMRQALCDVPRLSERGIVIAVSINLSVRNLHDPDLVETVRSAVALFPSMPQLTVEVTESAIMHDPERAIEALAELHEMGVEIAVDDFGVGHSSLAYLRALPIHEIKIDKSFVAGMMTSPDDVSIVRAIVRLGHDLGLRVVAEGVENKSTLELAESVGCDVAQGYFLSYPMYIDDLITWLEEHPTNEPPLRSASSA